MLSKRILTLLFFYLFIPTIIFAQVTTSNIIGSVKDTTGKDLGGANIEAVHQPSGTRYKTITSSNGRFALSALRVGGPYALTVTYVGYKAENVNDVYLQLGEATKIDFELIENKTQLSEVVVTASGRRPIISKETKGTGANFSRRQIASLPTLSRSITDITKLVPQSNGTSFGGQDNRMINLTIDGSIFNNSFGLQPLPGSQTNSAPFSLDALEEIQVNLSPYNLKDANFTGASINAITRSGTNTFHGSGFYNQRNEGYAGKNAGLGGKQKVVVADFDVKQYGVSIGGPIIKNKLFFFLNYEAERRNDPGSAYVADDGSGATGGNVTRVKKTDLDQLSEFLKTNFGYDTGPYQDYFLTTKSDKALAKLDWNISDKHKLSFRFNMLKSQRDIPPSTSGSFQGRRDNLFSMAYANTNYIQHNDLYSGIFMLNSRFSTKIANELIFGYTANRDSRAFNSIPMPLVDILDGNERNYIAFGAEPFTPNNILNTDTWQFSDNLNFYLGKHTISTGVNFESFKFFNQFTPTVFGQYVFNTLADFYTSANAYLSDNNMTENPVALRRYSLTFSNMPEHALWNAVTKAKQLGVYIQDDTELEEGRLNITYGVRFDVPFFNGSGFVNNEVDGFDFVNEKDETVKLSTSQLPSAKVMINPRFGFNYDVSGRKTTQLRGGVGIFSGRPAFVWISNQIGNNGVQSGSLTQDNTKVYPFSPDVTRNIPNNITPGTPAPSYNLATTEKDFRFPQIMKANIALDQKVFNNVIITGEFLFQQSLSNMYYYNGNLKPAATTFAGPDNRARFAGVGLSGATLNNAIRINPKITDATVLGSRPYGQSIMATFKIEKQARTGFSWLAAYNYGSSKDYITAGSIAFSSWRDNKSINGNNKSQLDFSDYDIRHRVLGNINYRIEFAKTAAVQISLFGQSISQGRFSYAYSGDMNGDGVANNDLMYIPRDQSEMNFEQYTSGGVTYTVQAQKDAFEAFIKQDEYMSTHRGTVANRNGVLRPMLTRFDASIIVEFFRNIGKNRHTIQLRGDIFNLGNMFKHSWGVSDQINTTSPLTARGVDANGVPRFRMNAVSNSLTYGTYFRGATINDVWQAQFGVRYIF